MIIIRYTHPVNDGYDYISARDFMEALQKIDHLKTIFPGKNIYFDIYQKIGG